MVSLISNIPIALVLISTKAAVRGTTPTTAGTSFRELAQRRFSTAAFATIMERQLLTLLPIQEPLAWTMRSSKNG